MSAFRTSAALLLAFLCCFGAFAAEPLAPVPALTARVTDHTNTLTPEQRAALEQKLVAFEARKGAQIAVLMVASTLPESVEQYALRVAEQWKLGRKQVDDGALLLIAKNDRALRIEVGYGLEGALTDATSKRIISEIIVPRFQQGDFYGGIDAGLGRMIGVLEGEPLPPPKQAQKQSGDVDAGSYLPLIFLFALGFGGVMRAILGRFGGALVTGGALGALAWWIAGTLFIGLAAGVVAFVVTLLGRGVGGFVPGGFGGSRSGGFGGGFGGGGGGFGGGGASGRW